jgi:ribosomal protein S30
VDASRVSPRLKGGKALHWTPKAPAKQRRQRLFHRQQRAELICHYFVTVNNGFLKFAYAKK